VKEGMRNKKKKKVEIVLGDYHSSRGLRWEMGEGEVSLVRGRTGVAGGRGKCMGTGRDGTM